MVMTRWCSGLTQPHADTHTVLRVSTCPLTASYSTRCTIKFRDLVPFLPTENTAKPPLFFAPRYSQHPFDSTRIRRISNCALRCGMIFVRAFSRCCFDISLATLPEYAYDVKCNFPIFCQNHRKIRERQKATLFGFKIKITWLWLVDPSIGGY